MTEHEGRYLGGGHRKGGSGGAEGSKEREVEETKEVDAKESEGRSLGSRAAGAHHPKGWGSNRSERDM